ncbi:MAG: LysR substrate-binding domain-containing protein [Planctomycetota bacterium]
MPERPTLRQLEYFLAIRETLNFRAAAEACFVTQPALSTQLQQLERRLGVQLFERDKRSVRPTAAGERLATQAQEILSRVDVFIEEAQTERPPLSGELSLGVIPTVAPYLLPRLLGPLRERHPELRLFLHEAQTQDLVQRALEGELDVLLLALEADLRGLQTEALFSDPFLVALPPGHPLTGEELVRLGQLDGEPMLLLEEGHCLRDQSLPACEAAGSYELDAYRASSLGTLVQMVAGGLGLTMLPEIAVALESRAGEGVVVRELESDGPSRTIGLAWRSASVRGEEFRALADSLRAIYAAS